MYRVYRLDQSISGINYTVGFINHVHIVHNKFDLKYYAKVYFSIPLRFPVCKFSPGKKPESISIGMTDIV